MSPGDERTGSEEPVPNIVAVPIGYRHESKAFIAAARDTHRANRHNYNNQWDHPECIICSAYSHDAAYRVRTRYAGHRANYRYLTWWWQVEERLETINADPRSVVAFQICLKIYRMTPTRWEWDWIVLLEVGEVQGRG